MPWGPLVRTVGLGYALAWMSESKKAGSNPIAPNDAGAKPVKARPRSLEDALRLTNPDKVELAEDQLMYPPEAVAQFMAGAITLGELEGITKTDQYAMAEKGYAMLQAGKLENARTVFEGLLALDPYDAYFHLVRGSIRQRAGEYEDAEASYTKAISINPTLASAFANRGEVRLVMGKVEEGATDLVEALKADPEGKEAAVQRARATLGALKEKLEGMKEAPKK